VNTLGFYGKIACRGDFVSRGLSHHFIQPWDQWLAAGLQASQQQLGADWLEAYLVSPLWRFALAPGLCGPQTVVGVLMPSIDRVGRYFPLTVAQLLDSAQPLSQLVAADDAWFEQVETALLSTLVPGATFEAFEAALPALALADHGARPGMPSAPVGGLAQRLDASTPRQRLHALAERACAGASLWWGKGCARIAPGLMHCAGLPRSEDFARALLGSEACPL